MRVSSVSVLLQKKQLDNKSVKFHNTELEIKDISCSNSVSFKGVKGATSFGALFGGLTTLAFGPIGLLGAVAAACLGHKVEESNKKFKDEHHGYSADELI